MSIKHRTIFLQEMQQGSWRGQGWKAFQAGQPYGANPWNAREQPQAHLAWSQGHNNARVEAARPYNREECA